MNLEEIFKRIFNSSEYAECQKYPCDRNNPWYVFFNHDIPAAMKLLVERKKGAWNANFICKGTIGIGRLSDTFSFCVLSESVTNRTQSGVYIAYLVAPGGDAIYLTLIQGSEIISSSTQLEKRRRILTGKSQEILETFRFYATEHSIDDPAAAFACGQIDLQGRSMTSKAYEVATLFSKKYTRNDEDHSNEKLEADFKQMLDVYKRYQFFLTTNRVAPSN